MAELHADPKHTDMIMVCEGKEFKVHRAIVCSQSKTIASQIEGEFKERNGIIKHDTYDEATVDRMIQFLYTQDYQLSTSLEVPDLETGDVQTGLANMSLEPGKNDESDPIVARMREVSTRENVMAHVQVHGLASYYDIPQLKIAGSTKLAEALAVAKWDLDDFLELVEHVYRQSRSQSLGLRASVVEFGSTHLNELTKNDVFFKAARTFGRQGEFCVDMLPKLQDEMRKKVSSGLETEERLSKKIREMGAAKIQAEVNADGEKANFERAVHVIKTVAKCRHCKERLGATIETSPGAGGITLYKVRCKKCSTRQL